MKKLLSVALVVVMIMGMASFTAVADEAQELTKVNFLVSANSATTDMNGEEWAWVHELAEQNGLDVEWTMMYTGWSDKRAAMLASGETYDAYFGWRVYKSSEILANAEMFYDMSPIVAESAPALASLLESDGTLASNMVQEDGSILYATTVMPFRPLGYESIMINTTYLEALNMEEPQTLEELEAYLYAVRDNDVNGNGDTTDEIAIWGDATDWKAGGLGAIMGAFGVKTSTDNGFSANEDGTLTFAPITENFKEYVKTIAKWYADGLSAEECVALDSDTSAARLGGENTVVGLYVTGWEQWPASDEIWAQYKATAPVEGANGDRFICCNWLTSLYDSNPMFAMSYDTTAPEKTLSFVDEFFADDLTAVQMYYGPIGTTLEYNDEGTLYMIDAPEGVSNDTWNYMYSMRGSWPSYVTPGWDDMICPAADANKNAMDKVNEPYYELDSYVPNLKFTAEQTEELSSVATDIEDYISTCMANWFLGNSDVEADWDNYIATLEAMGLETYINIYQEAYTAYVG